MSDGAMSDGPVSDGAVGSARQEAERLVATVLGSLSLAAARASLHVEAGCGCPVCRAVVALRDPDPEIANRLANGVGDLAEGVAGLLRAMHGRRVPERDGE